MNRILNKRLLALLYPWVLSCAVLYLFVPEKIRFASLVALAVCAGFFALFTLENKLKRTAPLLYLLYSATVAAAFYYLVYQKLGKMGLMSYLLAESRDITTAELLGFMLAICFLQCSLSFYFTEVRYRQSGLLLITLIPCAFYVQQGEDLRNSYIAAIVILFLLIAVFYRREPDRLRTKTLFARTAGIAAAVLAAVTAGIAVLLPFPKDPPLGYLVEKYLPEFQAQRNSRGEESRDMGAYAEVAGADYYQELTDEILFYVKADEPLYLRKQVYDVYEPAQGWRVLDNDSITQGSSGWEDNAAVYSPQGWYAAVADAAKLDAEFAKKYGLTDLPEFGTNMAAQSTATVISYQYHSFHLLNTLYTTGYPSLGFSTYRNLSGEIFRTRDYEVYDLDRYEFTYVPELADRLAEAISQDAADSETFLTDFYFVLAENERTDEAALVSLALQNNAKATQYAELVEAEIPAKIQTLAEQLTANCTNDYEKAEALMAYFSQNSFYYDADYIPPTQWQNDAEYFLLESRRGVCADFASAMTLLARAAGLPARYVSGFYAGELKSEGILVVRQDDAHAFCEIYLTGVGWRTFDATAEAIVAADSADQNGGGFLENLHLPLKWILPVLAAVGIALAVFLLRGKIRMLVVKWRVFGTRLGKLISRSKAVPEQGAVRLFVAARKLLYSRNERALVSAGQVLERARTGFDTEISCVTDCFEQACYGERSPADDKLQRAFVQYQSLYRAVRQAKKQEKKHGRRKHLDKLPQNGV